MLIFKRSKDIKHYLEQVRKQGKTIGFVPTMGALHEGHLDLLEACRTKSDIAVCSIFVNPTQFNNASDFEKYPITVSRDIQLLESRNCDILFLPAVNEMYPDKIAVDKHYDLGHLESILEGEFRPGHFQGVCTIVNKLLRITEPTKLFMGAKDFQQCMVIKKLLLIEQIECQLIICETKRETSGLAMSSRNTRLSEEGKKKAACIFESLTLIKDSKKHNLLEIKELCNKKLKSNGLQPEYIEVCSSNDLKPLSDFNLGLPMVALIAAHLEGVRLLDNMIIN